MVSRAERSRLADWWFTVDKLLLTAFLCLIFGGIVLSLAASPAVAERIGIDDSYYFVKRQAFFALPAIAVMLFVSFMDPRQIRRFALVGFGVCVVLLVATLFIGPEIKGSRRWLDFKVMSIQPSEFMKPMFAVVVGFLLAEAQKRPDVPGRIFSFLVLGIVVALLVAQPDFGQTMLTCLAWAGLLFLAGMSWLWILGLAGVGAGGIVAAYTLVPHVRSRIDRFLNPDQGDSFQVSTAQEAFVNGGWFGTGPGRVRSSESCRTATPTSSSPCSARSSGSSSAWRSWRCSPSPSCGPSPMPCARTTPTSGSRRRASPSCSACSPASTWR